MRGTSIVRSERHVRGVKGVSQLVRLSLHYFVVIVYQIEFDKTRWSG